MAVKKSAGPEMAARGRELKKFQKIYLGRKMAWIGGILYFTDTNPPAEVLEAKELPKEGKEAIGLAANLRLHSRGKFSSRPQPRGGEIYFNSLPQEKDTDGQCCKCNLYPNDTKTIMTADYGEKTVVECRRCHTLMRPLARRRTSSW